MCFSLCSCLYVRFFVCVCVNNLVCQGAIGCKLIIRLSIRSLRRGRRGSGGGGLVVGGSAEQVVVVVQVRVVNLPSKMLRGHSPSNQTQLYWTGQ